MRDAKKYPELSKLNSVGTEYKQLNAFLDWLDQEKKLDLVERKTGMTCTTRLEELVAEYLELDLKKIEDERRALLEEAQALL